MSDPIVVDSEVKSAGRLPSRLEPKPKVSEAAKLLKVPTATTVAQNDGLPPTVDAAVREVKTVYTQFKHSTWSLAMAVAKLKHECEENGLQYLKIVSTHLKEMYADGMSPATVSKLAAAADYVTAKKVTVPTDAATFPTYSQVAPLKRFLNKDKRAKKLQPQWDALHNRVFAADPKTQPSVKEVSKEVSNLFAPPKPATPRTTTAGDEAAVQTGLEPEQITLESIQEWFGKSAVDGRVVIHRVRVGKMTPDVIAGAIKASWASLKTAKYIKIEVI
jgi:hypothetical protein